MNLRVGLKSDFTKNYQNASTQLMFLFPNLLGILRMGKKFANVNPLCIVVDVDDKSVIIALYINDL